ncbi:MAG TPA: hypothetical protein VMV10_28105 [Pirellulales bacterium]|nr:hypothetical protein [Pirellulales bacterium]
MYHVIACRPKWVAPLAGAVLWACLATIALAEDHTVSQLPLKKVVLFNSGVGFFQHDGEVTGDAQVEMKFNVDDVNDLLKSLVLEDLGGGRISTVTYGSRDPLAKTLKTFAIDLTDNPTLAKLLDQVRGERVEIESPNKIVGVILGVETRKQKAGEKETIEVEYLNLLTDEGLRSAPLASISRIKLLNEALDRELRQALAVLALGHATDKKSVTLHFLGDGKRAVRVGYIQEAPIWKTSYRLVLASEGQPLLQGWALVENTTEEDWKDVSLSLVSGRPISFIMNLYEPLYVPRPIVEPELFASLRPQTYGQAMEGEELGVAEADKPAGGALMRKAGAAAAPAAPQRRARMLAAKRGEAFFAGGENAAVRSVAQAAEVGELFQYAIDTPVDLPRQQSAMLPIVNGKVEGEKLSIYNPMVQPKHPLNGLRLKNTTDLHLMQGPITVFDGGSYAGDARIEDLPPGGERLISYALDLDTEVVAESKGHPDQLVSVSLAKGVLHASRKLVREQLYTAKNSSKQPKRLLVEYPVDPSWKLVAPVKPAEKTRDLYRFALQVEPGKPAKLTVEEEQLVSQEVGASNLDGGSIQLYLRSPVVSEAIKQALQEIVKRKSEIEQLTQRQQQDEQQINAITQEQARIRENMAQLERNSDLYNRYVKKFGSQEDEVEKLRAEISKLQQQANEKRRSLSEYLLGLDSK